MGSVCNQDGINLISHVMKCSELTRLLWSHSVQERGQAVCVFPFGFAINDEGSTWSVRLVAEQCAAFHPKRIGGLGSWQPRSQCTFRISMWKTCWRVWEGHVSENNPNSRINTWLGRILNIEHCASLDFIPAPPQMVSVQVDLLTLRQMPPSSWLHLLWARTHIYIFQRSSVYTPQQMRWPGILWQ